MLSRGMIGTAVIVYLLALGCVIGTATTPSARTSTAESSHATATSTLPAGVLPFRGAGMQIQRVDWADKYKQSIDEIAAVGCDTVSLVVDARQENANSNKIYLDMRMTPTPDMLAGIIDHAKSKNLRVVLMPIVLLDDPRERDWRGVIKPENWNEWFDSYREMITHFAWIAQGHGVDLLVVGSELVSSEPKVDQWTTTISKVREVYKGKLTYSSNWDHYTAVPFWDQLDLIGMNSYYKLGDDRDVKVEEIERRWKDIQKDLLSFQAKIGKPLMFLEVGWCSLANAAHEPWDYTKQSEPVDLDLQRKLYEGYLRSWYGKAALGGFIVWEWTPGDGGENDKGYTPEGKPAEKVLREWLAKPRWEVK